MRLKKKKLQIAITGILAFLLVACGERTSEDSVADVSSVTEETAIVEAVPIESPEMALGKRVFASCASCHTIASGAPGGIGPNLSGVIGSTAGSKSAFAYSDALKGSGIMWTEENFDRYIANPASVVPGGSMEFVGIADEAGRKAVLQYVIAMSSDDGSELSVPSDQGKDSANWE